MRETSLDQVRQSLAEAKEDFGRSRFFYDTVWTEAQISSGKADEEWGLDLFLCLLRWGQEDAGRTIPASQLSDGEYIIHGNIALSLRAVGRVSEARELAAIQENSLVTYHGIDTINRPFRELGPLFDFLPDARNRRFPILKKDVDPESSSYNRFINYEKMYAVQGVAGACLDVGDWVRAAELRRWFTDYASEYCLSRLHNRGEVSRRAMYAHFALADICMMHGAHDEAIAEYDAFIAKNRQENYPSSEHFIHYAKLKKLLHLRQLELLPDDAAEIAEEAYKSIARYTYYGRTTKITARADLARIHHAMGNRKHAWEIMNELMVGAESDVNGHHQMQLLPAMVDIALKEGGRHPELENWLIRLLEFERTMGRKFRELPLYEDYASFLMLNGRLTEAADILREAVRLSVALNIPYREKKNRVAVQELVSFDVPIASKTGGSIRQDAPTTDSEEDSDHRVAVGSDSRQVDIQPVSSRVVVVTDSIAHGRFYITNPSLLEKRGELQLSGPFSSNEWVDDNHLSAVFDSAEAVKSVSHPVTLDPGSSSVVDVKGRSGLDGVETEISCKWVENDVPVSDGIWVYQSSTVATKRSVIDAHAVRANPFYLVPIHHMILRTGDFSASDHVDFRIAASDPMRIEVYDDTGTKLICVDANGDGDFGDKGDLVHQDLNGNMHPDLTLKEGKEFASLVMYVDTQANSSEADEEAREISISILEDGEWRLDAVDLVE